MSEWGMVIITYPYECNKIFDDFRIYTDQGQSIAIDTVECVLTNLATEP